MDVDLEVSEGDGEEATQLFVGCLFVVVVFVGRETSSLGKRTHRGGACYLCPPGNHPHRPTAQPKYDHEHQYSPYFHQKSTKFDENRHWSVGRTMALVFTDVICTLLPYIRQIFVLI